MVSTSQNGSYWHVGRCQVLGDHFHVSFSQFGGEMKHKTPREGGHSSSLSGEEDEQSTPKWCHFGKMCNSSSTSDASQLHL